MVLPIGVTPVLFALCAIVVGDFLRGVGALSYGVFRQGVGRYARCGASGGDGVIRCAREVDAVIWINRTVGTIEEREVLRIFRNRIGDWCAELIFAHQIKIAVLDYHPSVPLLQILLNTGADIAEDVITQGAEGVDMSWHSDQNDD